MLGEYLGIVITIVAAFVISCVLYCISYLLIYREYNIEKLLAYECGFNAFTDSRDVFDVRFYLVAILFLVFDLEIIFLFPWCVVLGSLDYFSFGVMVTFIVLLLFGFIYEWRNGALDW